MGAEGYYRDNGLVSNPAYQASQQRSARRKVLNQNGFMQRMSAFSDCPQTIQSGNTKCRGEVSVGTAACASFFQRESKFCGISVRLVKERGDLLSSLHRRTIDAASNLQLASGIGDGKRLKFAG